MQDRPKHSPPDEVPSSRRLKGGNRGRDEMSAGEWWGSSGVEGGQLRSGGPKKKKGVESRDWLGDWTAYT